MSPKWVIPVLAIMLVTRAWCQCPAGCEECGGGGSEDQLEFACGELVVKTRDDGAAEVDCQGHPLNCSTLPSIPTFRGRVAKRLQLTRCGLGAESLACVAETLNANGTKVLALKRTSELREEHLLGLEQIEALLVLNPVSQPTVPWAALQSLPSLHQFRLQSAPSLTLSPHSPLNETSPPLTYLELSMSGLRALPARAFYGLDTLERLSLFGNKIESIDVDAFEGLSSLTLLVLNSNPLVSLPDGALSRAAALRRVTLDKVRLSNFTRGVLQGLEHLEQVSVYSERALALRGGALAGLPRLAAAAVTYSGVTSLPADLLAGSTALVNLTLASNAIAEIPPGLLAGLERLERLDLSRNRIGNVSRDMFLDLTALAHVDLSYNRITHLPDRLFSGLPSVSHVDLSHNKLAWVSPLAFLTSPSISWLDVSHNALPWAPAPPTEFSALGESSPLAALVGLRHLDLSHNHISVVYSDWRYVLLRLHTLDLSYNAFEELDAADLHFLNDNISVSFEHNNITYVGVSEEAGGAGRARVSLAANPLHCDCRALGAVRAARRADPRLLGAACAAPPALAGRALAGVEPLALECDLPPAGDCRCVLRAAAARLECACGASRPPAPGAWGARSVRLRAPPAALRALPPYVTELALAGAGLAALPAALSPHVAHADLSRNLLSAAPRALLRPNTTLLLAGNPLACDCAHVADLLELERHRDLILDYANLTCAGGDAPASSAARRACGAALAWSAGALAALGAAAALAALAYRLRRTVRVWLYKAGLCAEAEDADAEWDVFVVFAGAQWPLVRDELLPRLEAEWRVRVAFRDWAAGGHIPTAIAASVASARRTLVVCGAEGAGGWAGAALAAARAAARDGRARGVLVAAGAPLPPAPPDPLVRVVPYPHAHFWRRLRRALPPPRRAPAPPAQKAPPALDVQLSPDGRLHNAALRKY